MNGIKLSHFRTDPMSQGNFQLPGLSAHPNGQASLSVTLAFAYSRRWNRRRLEHHTYAFWDKVFSYLIYDLEPYLFHIPQLMLHDPPAEHPDVSIRTDPGANGDECIPDFSIMSVHAMHRYRSSSSTNPRFPALEDWDRLRIESAKPLVIAELKRPAPRSAKDALEFHARLRSLMNLAIDDAEEQARLAFGVTLYKELDEIILITACGEWWRFRVATRKDMLSEDIWDPLVSPAWDEDGDDDNDKVSYKHPSRGETPGHRVTASVQRYTALGSDVMAVFNGDVEDAMPPADEWSKFILFGTEASNQHFFFIHRWLKEQRGEAPVTYAAKSNKVR
jgi:hypothetical protein